MKLRLILPVLGLALVGVLAYSYAGAGPIEQATEGGTPVGDASRSPVATPVGPRAQVRFVNAMPGSPALELGHDSLMLFSNVVFGAVSPFKPVAPTRFRFTLRGPATVGFDAASVMTLVANEHYSILAVPDTLGRMTVRVIRDDLAPDSGMARIRLIRATPRLDNVEFAIVGQDEPLFRAKTESGDAHYRDVSPMTAGFRVRGGADGATLVSLKSMALVAGSTYTFVLTSRPQGAVTAIVFSDLADESPRPVAVAQQ
ncbi:MAG: DUF4397 domain-containing protein [Gemmatimonadaceae bacterium]|nr:DUF4397 domain-containing protein [Gemmatimonadaceae bacterium]